jgi:hypothetical protein
MQRPVFWTGLFYRAVNAANSSIAWPFASRLAFSMRR